MAGMGCYVCMYVCVCVCGRACVRTCVRAYVRTYVRTYVCMKKKEEEICLFNIVCSYTNSAMLITYTCRETPNGWNLISRLQGAT